MDVRWLSWIILISVAYSAADSIFKSCKESDFCNRLRYKDDGTVYSAKPIEPSRTFILKNNMDFTELIFKYEFLENAFRLTINELEPSSRFRLDGVLDNTPDVVAIENVTTNEKTIFYSGSDNEKYGIAINHNPFRIEFFKGENLETVAVANVNDRLTVETGEPNVAIALDVQFLKAQRAYGIPSHADNLALRTTVNEEEDPYRLFNVDEPYGLNSTAGLYGSVPVLYAHGTSYSMGMFWHNAAETWVEIDNKGDSVNTYFMSESGVLDFFVMMGPTPQDAVRTYSSLTGTAPLPQYFTLGYHQSRWNYNSEEDVQTVVAEFDNHDLPLDVMWLDIEYTDGKKYFTWDPVNFPNPLKMQANLTASNRKLVTIIDPHIKKEVGYFVYDQALAQDFFVKNADGSVFEGQCWPGLSSYIDFLNPEAQKYYAGLYAFDVFNGSTENTYIWNDMNEPAVFDDTTEKTFPRDTVHYGNVKHRDVHNVYGYFQTKGTYQGLLDRAENSKRPFILSRAHYAGSQRYAGIWTGDNTADWGHLAASLPMCLSEALAGISFCGADIGGFFNNPSVELLQRWYQVGAWLPFYRAHAHIETERREPYLFPEDVQARIRAALRQRYAHLPLWYTLFWEHYRNGDPVIRPLFFNYPKDSNTLDIDTQLLVGTSVMVAPVITPDVSSTNIYFPGGESERWYDANDYTIQRGIGYQSVNVTLDNIPVYYRGGTVISRKDTPRPTSVDMHNDSYSLYIFPNDNNLAEGTLYFDDMESFNYLNGEYHYITFLADKNTFRIVLEDANTKYAVNAKVDRVVLADPPPNVDIASIVTKGGINKDVPVLYRNNYMEVDNLELDLLDPFIIRWR